MHLEKEVVANIWMIIDGESFGCLGDELNLMGLKFKGFRGCSRLLGSQEQEGLNSSTVTALL